MVIDYAENSDVIALESVLVKRISKKYLTMFNANGSLRKTANSRLLQSFSRHPLLEIPSAHVRIVDIGIIWRFAFSTSDECDLNIRSGIDYLWHDYLDKMCLKVYSHQNNATIIILINDNYTVLTSIKDDKHERQSATHIPISLKFTQRKQKNSPLLPNLSKSC